MNNHKVKRSSRRPRPPQYVPINSPTIASVPAAASKELPPSLRNCGITITPPCLKALYRIPNATAATPGNSLGIFESGDYYSQQDIDMFFATYAPHIPQGTSPSPAFIDGAIAPAPQNSSDNGGESDVDLNIAYSIIYPQTVTLYQTDDAILAAESLNGTLDGFLNTFLDALDGVSREAKGLVEAMR
jgi:tripeptidyl-peptidase I